MAKQKGIPLPPSGIDNALGVSVGVDKGKRKRWSLKQVIMYSFLACGACFFLTTLFPSKPKPPAEGLPTVAALPTDVALVATADPTAAASTITATTENSTLSTTTLDNGQVNWAIERVQTQNKAAEWTPQQGMTYLIVVGTIHNPSNQDASLRAAQVRILIDGKEYAPLNGLMDRVKPDLNGMDFIGAYSGFDIATGQSRQAFVAFEVPLVRDSVSIRLDTQILALNSASGIEIAIGATATPNASATALYMTGGAVLTQAYETQTVEAMQADLSRTAEYATGAAVYTQLVGTRTQEAAIQATISKQTQSAPTATPPSVAISVPITAPTISAFEPFNETTYAVKIMDNLSLFAGGRNIGTVRVADGRPNGGERAIIVPYDTTETTTDAQIEEVADIYGTIGRTIFATNLDVDSVSLIMGVNGQAALIMVANASDTVAFGRGQMPRDNFLGSVQMTDLLNPENSTTGSSASQSSGVMTIDPKTYYADGEINVRACADTTCDIVIRLAQGDAVVVDGMIDGKAVNEGNKIWYRVTLNGKTGYVYSDLVSTVKPATVTTGGSSNGGQSGGSVPQSVPPAATGFSCPSNCAGAVAMGLSAQQAAACGMDRDGDGVACYGD